MRIFLAIVFIAALMLRALVVSAAAVGDCCDEMGACASSAHCAIDTCGSCQAPALLPTTPKFAPESLHVLVPQQDDAHRSKAVAQIWRPPKFDMSLS